MERLDWAGSATRKEGETFVASVYDVVGVKPVINARGIYSALGGSFLSRAIWKRIEDANRYAVDMTDLLAASGSERARLMGAEAGRVTPGVSAGIVLSVAACLSDRDGERADQLPDTSGMASKVMIQHNHRYIYDRMIRMAGGQLLVVGTERGTTLKQLAESITSEVAAIFFPAHLDESANTVSLDEVVRVAHDAGVPVLADAAYLIYPIEQMRGYTARGVDLVMFSAKYWGGPNAGGIVVGREDLIDGVAFADFSGFEGGAHFPLGRPFKLDRWTIMAVVLSLQDWLTLDHEARLAGYEHKVRLIQEALPVHNAILCTPMNFTMEGDVVEGPPNCLLIKLPNSTAASSVYQGLCDGYPAVVTHLREDALIVDVECLSDEDALHVASRLAQELEPAAIKS